MDATLPMSSEEYEQLVGAMGKQFNHKRPSVDADSDGDKDTADDDDTNHSSSRLFLEPHSGRSTNPWNSGDLIVCYKCTLCQHSNMRHCEVRAHSKEPVHRERLQRMMQRMELVQSAATKVARICSQPLYDDLAVLHEIQHQPSKDAVCAGLYRYIVSSTDPEQNYLEPTLKKLRKIEYSERLLILGLAVWKAQCLLQIPKFDHSAYFESLEWFQSGWKSCKSEMRNCNAMEIVATFVRPFLDPPSL